MRIRNMTERSTWITAWGLTRKHPKVWWPGCHRPGLVGGYEGGTTDATRLSGVAPALRWGMLGRARYRATASWTFSRPHFVARLTFYHVSVQDIVIPIPAQTPSMLRTPLNPKVGHSQAFVAFPFPSISRRATFCACHTSAAVEVYMP